MDKVTDKQRVDALGQGLAAQAAMAKMLRNQQINQQLEQALMTGPGAAAPMQQAPAQGGMSQAEFSGYGQPRPQPQANQQQLIELLRRRQMAAPPAQY